MHLKEQGWSRHDIAEALGVSPVSVSRWFARVRDGGPEALRAHPGSGRPPKLSSAQRRLIPEFLWHGAEAYGFRGEVGTCARVARVIEEELKNRRRSEIVPANDSSSTWALPLPIVVVNRLRRDSLPASPGIPHRRASGSWSSRRSSSRASAASPPTSRCI